MARTDLVIVDESVAQNRRTIKETCEAMESYIDTYLEIVDEILSEAIMEGETAGALKEFQGYAQKIKGTLPDIASEVDGMGANFMAEVDDADSFLY